MGNVRLSTPVSIIACASEVCDPSGVPVQIPAARVVGTLDLFGFVHPVTGDDSSGLTVVELNGWLPDGQSIVYRTVVGPAAFAPLWEDVVTLTRHRGGAAYAIAYSPSDAERRGLDVSVVPPVRMLGKYVTVNTAVWPNGPESLMVHYSFNSDDPRAVAGFLTLQFQLPIARLLWRRAPVVTPEGCIPEAAEYVDIELR